MELMAIIGKVWLANWSHMCGVVVFTIDGVNGNFLCLGHFVTFSWLFSESEFVWLPHRRKSHTLFASRFTANTSVCMSTSLVSLTMQSVSASEPKANAFQKRGWAQALSALDLLLCDAQWYLIFLCTHRRLLISLIDNQEWLIEF